LSETRDKKPPDRREAERARLIILRERQPLNDEATEPGVLLSDVIRRYCREFDLISPFDEDNLLKPACYRLTIGDEYATAGKIHPLPDQSGKNEIRIPPFAVAIVKTEETINMPPFLIGRWNIQVSRAYQGLVWVGGPQVDAGYVGHLFCPIYNLSDGEVVLHRGERIAVIDFEKTTRFHEGQSKPYPKLPNRILFEDYVPEQLGSGLVRHARRITEFEGEIKSIRDRVDNFVSVTFAVVAILFAAISFTALGKGSPPWSYISVFLLNGFAILFAASAWVKSKSEGRLFGRSVQIIIIVGLLLAFIFQIFWIRDQEKQICQLSKQVLELKSTQPGSTTTPSKMIAPGSKKPTPNKANQ
jgi:deoxycytidine triphosphate deaminase